MNSDNDLLHQPLPIQQKPTSSFKSLKPLIFLAVVLFIAVVAGMGGYWLGIRTGQKSEIVSQPAPIITPTTAGTTTPTPTVSPTTVPVLPTQIPALTANWKTYINAQWGLSFKYPETWFPTKVPLSSHQGDDAVNFYPVGVTPHPGEAGDPSNNVFGIQSTASQENMLNAASPPQGFQRVTVAGKPAIKGHSFCYIKLSSTSWIILFAPDENGVDVVKRFDTIISTIKFTNE